MRTWYCPKCYKNMGDNHYCPYCGAKDFEYDPPVETPVSLEADCVEEEGNPAMALVNLYWLNNL